MEMIQSTDIDDNDIDELNAELQGKLEDAGIDERDLLDEARSDLTLWDGYFGENIVRGKDDMNFLLRDQWSSVERAEFNRLFKFAMQFNKLYDTTKKVVAEQRKNKKELLVRSLTGNASQEQIDLRADLVRTIAYQSQNDLVYQNAFKQALQMGFGGFEINLEYENYKSFNQIIRYGLIPDITLTSFDPTAIKPHKGDGNFCSRQFPYSKQEFYATFPHIEDPVSYTDPRLLLDFQWQTRDTIVVCKYTHKEWFPLKVLLLTDGTTVTEDEWRAMQPTIEMRKQLAASSSVLDKVILRDIPEIHGERMSRNYKCRQYLLTQNKIIKFTDWPSKHLPMIFVDGDSNYINGQQYTRSFIHEAKDAQKFVNYVGSEIASEIKNRRREQWLGTPDNILGNETMWRNPELQNGMLIARPDPKTGMMPSKLPPWELSQTLLLQYQRANQDIREILGYSENEELQGHDMSGKARRERKTEGAMSAYVWFDNLAQAIEQGGRVSLDLLPIVVGENERKMIISKADGRTDSITLNKVVGQNQNGEAIRENTLDGGDYDIEIDTGPSFAVQKEIAIEFLQETLQANPQAFNLVADLWAKNLDVQFMPQLVERFKTMVPPEILAKEEGKAPPPPAPPSPQEQMMNAELQQKQQQLAINAHKMQVEEQDLAERAEELKIRKQEHLLEQVQMLLKAKESASNQNIAGQKVKIEHGKLLLDADRAEKDFSAKLASTLAELHKHNNPVEKQNNL